LCLTPYNQFDAPLPKQFSLKRTLAVNAYLGRAIAQSVHWCISNQEIMQGMSFDNAVQNWKHRARSLKRDIHALYLARCDPRVPWYAKLLGAVIIAYALSPIDLIPDFIPVLGYLDDLVLLPTGILLLLKLVPPAVLEEYRIQARNSELVISKNWLFAALIVFVWVLALAFAIRVMYRWAKHA
jgi:uncharacterized membrane protein YkvA (DUF1232 family)